jgi:hypothetical protein
VIFGLKTVLNKRRSVSVSALPEPNSKKKNWALPRINAPPWAALGNYEITKLPNYLRPFRFLQGLDVSLQSASIFAFCLKFSLKFLHQAFEARDLYL